MAERLGIAINPDVLALLFRTGAVITGKHGFTARLIEGALPNNYNLLDCGYDKELGQFWLVFGPEGDIKPGEIRWISPIYEREGQHGANS